MKGMIDPTRIVDVSGEVEWQIRDSWQRSREIYEGAASSCDMLGSCCYMVHVSLTRPILATRRTRTSRSR